jgi:hypothetical protein
MFNKFKAEYASKDKMLQCFFLNTSILESENMKEVGMEEGAYVECFNILNFFTGRNLAGIAGCNISVHFVLRL